MTIFGDYFERAESFQKKFGEDLPPDPMRTGWQIARSGNLYKQYRSITLTLFPGKQTKYTLCIAGPSSWGRRFFDLGAANLNDALKESERKADHVINDDICLRRHVNGKGVR